MSQKKKDIWFPAKKYGVGWGLPIAWQGWAVFFLYLVMVIVPSFMVTGSSRGMVLFVFYSIFLTALLVYICWKKGEKLNFRWGDKSK